LARKQRADRVLVECALTRPNVILEINALDNSFGGGGAAEAIAFTFFIGGDLPYDLSSIPSSRFLGQVVVINYQMPGKTQFDIYYVFEAIVPEPIIRGKLGDHSSLLNNFICAPGEFECLVKGQIIKTLAVYFCQQNNKTHVCAHASLRMVINTIKGKSDFITSGEINQTLGIVSPNQGLTLQQIKQVVDSLPGLEAEIIDCQALKPYYLSILASIVESGDLALLIFTTGRGSQHVVPVYGHTRNSDEWHPEALPGYTGAPAAPFYPSSAWIDHFLIHDDNFGPYFSLSSRALEVDPQISAQKIIAVRASTPALSAMVAESSAAIILHGLRSQGLAGTGNWFDYWNGYRGKFVLRPILIQRGDYLVHLQALKTHDGSVADPNEISQFSLLPEVFWMVEFSLPALYTGNRSKLGEVLISTQQMTTNVDLLAVRLPSLILVTNSGAFNSMPSKVMSHAHVYRHRAHDHEW
jgi:hypothetical protein